jgi:hypothetical protein
MKLSVIHILIDEFFFHHVKTIYKIHAKKFDLSGFYKNSLIELFILDKLMYMIQADKL